MKIFIAVIAMCIIMQLNASDPSKSYALAHGGAKIDTYVRVVDECENPISNVTIVAAFYNGIDKSKDTFFRGVSDVDGICRIKGKCKYNMTLRAKKDGYYSGLVYEDLLDMKETPAVVDGVWQSPKAGYQITLKRPRNPIPLNRLPDKYEVQWRKIPVINEWIGYDFDKWDFCKPYGLGISEDVLLRFSRFDSPVRFNKWKCQDFTFEMSFTNHPHSGFYILKRDSNSQLEYEYSATTNKEGYLSYIKYECKNGENGFTALSTTLQDNEYIVFRTRTKVDEEDNIVSANYGRLAGGIRFYDNFVIGQGWFNPNVNDPNLEDGDYWAYIERERAKQKKKSKKGFFNFLK